jgi:hypothetical protein
MAEREPTMVEQILAKLGKAVERGAPLPPVRRANWCPGAYLLRDGKPYRRRCENAVAVQKVEDKREVPDNEREPDRFVTLGLCWSCNEAEKDMRAGLRQAAIQARSSNGDGQRSGRSRT